MLPDFTLTLEQECEIAKAKLLAKELPRQELEELVVSLLAQKMLHQNLAVKLGAPC